MPDEKNMELSEKGLLSRDNAADDEDKIVPAAASFRQEASAADGNCGGHRWLKNKKRGTVPDDAAAPSSSSSNKKRRCVWTDDLHQKFVAAFNQLGSTDAVPQKILGVMNVPGLTRDHVGSHLQKYRDRLRQELRRLQEESSSPISQPPAAPNTPPIGNANSTSVHMNQNSLLMHHRPPQPAAVRMQHEHDPGATAAPGQSNWNMDHPSIDKSVMISGCYSVPEKTQEVMGFPGFPSNNVGNQFEKHRMLLRRQQQLQQELGLSLKNQVPAATPNPAFNNVISASILMQHHDHEPKAIWNVDHPFINKELSYCSTISGCSRTSISGSLSSTISGSSNSTISDAVPKGIPEVMEAGLIGDIVASQLEAYQILQRVNQLGEQQLEQGSSLINPVPAAPNNPIGDVNNNVNSGSIHMPQKLSQYRQPVAPPMVNHMYRQHHDLQRPVAPMHHDDPQPIRIMDDVPFINEKGSMTSGRCSSMISSFNFEVEENRTCSWSTGGIDNHTGHGWGIESTLLPSNLGQFQDDIDELLLGFYD